MRRAAAGQAGDLYSGASRRDGCAGCESRSRLHALGRGREFCALGWLLRSSADADALMRSPEGAKRNPGNGGFTPDYGLAVCIRVKR